MNLFCPTYKRTKEGKEGRKRKEEWQEIKKRGRKKKENYEEIVE